ncbi:hypothetical protein Vretimale_16143 [Volvox reticuliferus]|uniref:Uncharacterized protein n=1 Tax=Volvox reticuliferus TaxID=1737510 RepID=A0A8J4GSY3_9CHLO|nr:hypothetical protein Vretimale_16143 [Volvox reticuliferus]
MPPETIPKDPVYMSYITRHHAEVQHPSQQRASSPFRPFSGLTYTDQQLQGSRAVYPHFHRPFNDHSRYLAVASGVDRSVYRDLPRLPPPPWDGSMDAEESDRQQYGGGPRRPVSAPPPDRVGSNISMQQQQAASPTLRLDLRGITLADNMVTTTGRPCYTQSAFVEADMDSGNPITDIPHAIERLTNVAVVQTYPVPPSIVGYGSGGVRPFHQDYRHYKYYGFAGKGAKSSWAHNPKYSKVYADLLTSGDSTAPALAFQDVPVAPPLQEVLGGPRRPLTATERKLVNEFKWPKYKPEVIVSETSPFPTPRAPPPAPPPLSRTPPCRVTELVAFSPHPHPQPHSPRPNLRRPPKPHSPHPHLRNTTRWHNYDAEGIPSDPTVTRLLAHVAAGAPPTPRTVRHLKLTPQQQRPQQARTRSARRHTSRTESAIIEPYLAKVDLDRRQALATGTSTAGDVGTARVTTYRQMASPYAAEINRSPNQGSQSPWHQRYSHYKYSGFAGKGATSSWARNPKYAYLYD